MSCFSHWLLLPSFTSGNLPIRDVFIGALHDMITLMLSLSNLMLIRLNHRHQVHHGGTTEARFRVQVFSKQQSEDDSCVWEETSRSGRRPYAEAFWLQLLGLCWDPELGASAGVPIASAARSRVSMREMSRALAMLFCDAQSLHAACGVFSELTWQVEDRNFLGQLVSQLQEVKVLLNSFPSFGRQYHNHSNQPGFLKFGKLFKQLNFR